MKEHDEETTCVRLQEGVCSVWKEFRELKEERARLQERLEVVYDASGISKMRTALERINELRNDIVARQRMGWPLHVYPLVAILDGAGFEGAGYKDARRKLEATIAEARGLAGSAWAQKKTIGKVMDPVLAEEFAEILFPFLEVLAFYSFPENWTLQDQPSGVSACGRDLGARARLALGRPDRDVPEDGDDG